MVRGDLKSVSFVGNIENLQWKPCNVSLWNGLGLRLIRPWENFHSQVEKLRSFSLVTKHA